MPHSYFLTSAAEEGALVRLVIYTNEDGLIQRMGPPSYRAGDAAMKQLLIDWQAYVDVFGSPPGEAEQNVTLFWAFLEQTYGAAYKVGQRH